MSFDYEQAKQTTKFIWGLGDYRPLARLMEEASHELVDACGISNGNQVLDVAAGDGNCAVAATRKGAAVVATDLTPLLVEQGRERTEAEGLAIEWQEADVEDLPFPDNRFDTVTSVFGAIFAPRPAVAASEMFRVVKPGGVVGMANWTPRSFSKRMMDAISRHAPHPPPPGPSPFEWGDEDEVRLRFGPFSSSIELARRVLRWTFESLDAMRGVFESHGGSVMAKKTLPPETWDAQGRALEELVTEVNEGSKGQIVIPNEYLIVVARKTA